MFVGIRLGVEIRKLGTVIFMSEMSMKIIRPNLSNVLLSDSEKLLCYFVQTFSLGSYKNCHI